MAITTKIIDTCDICSKEITGVTNTCPTCEKVVCYSCSNEFGDVYHVNLCKDCNKNRPETHAILEKWKNHFVEDYKTIKKELQEAKRGDSIPDVPYNEQHFRWY